MLLPNFFSVSADLRLCRSRERGRVTITSPRISSETGSCPTTTAVRKDDSATSFLVSVATAVLLTSLIEVAT